MLTVCKSICVSTRLDRSVCQQYRPHDNALDIYPYLFDAINIRQKKYHTITINRIPIYVVLPIFVCYTRAQTNIFACIHSV